MTLLSQRKAVAVFAVFACAYFLSALVRAITATLAPTLVQELELGAADLGLLAGAYFLGFALTQLPMGAWLDRHGPKQVEAAFLLAAIVGCAAFAAAHNFAGLLLARVLCGVGLSACLMAALTGYRRWYAPAFLMRANAWMLMVGALGTVASTLPVQWLLPLMGWRPIFWLLAGALVLALAGLLWQLPAWEPVIQPPQGLATPSTPAGQAPGYAHIWRNPYFRSLVPLGLLGYGGLVAMQTLWVTPWMVRVAGFSPAGAANGLFWISLALLGMYGFWGSVNPWLARHGRGTDWLLLRCLPSSFVPLAFLVATGAQWSAAAPWAWGVFCVLATVCTLAQPAVGMAFGAEWAGRALSAYNLVVFCGVFAVQWGMGLAIDALRSQGWAETAAYQGALGLYALCYAGAYLFFVQCQRRHNQSTTAAPP